MLRRVRRAMAITTVIVAVVCIPAGPALADLGDADPGGGDASTSTTVDTTPTTDPSSDSTTTTTTTPPDPSTTTTTAPADDDAGATTTSTSTSTTSTAPGASTTSTSFPSSGGSGRSTTNTTRPSSTMTTAPGSTTTTAPALSPAGTVVSNETAGDASPGGDSGGAPGGSTSSGGSGRSTHPSPTRPDKNTEESPEMTADTLPDPLSFPGDTPYPGFEASGLGGLFGVGTTANPVPAGVTSGLALADSESALPSRDHDSPSLLAVLGLSLLILVALAGGTAYRWWDRRPGRYWPA